MNNLYLIIGPSGSGKTELSNALAKKYYLKPVESYTTRPPRCPDEKGHIFVTEDHFNALGEMCAYTEYNGYRYGVTKNILDASDIYVIDPDGALYLFDRYTWKNLYYIWLDTSPLVCYERMIVRGDESAAAVDRVQYDKEAFSLAKMAEVRSKIHGAVIKTDNLNAEQVRKTAWTCIRANELADGTEWRPVCIPVSNFTWKAD